MRLAGIYNKYHNISVAKKATIWYAFSNVLQRGISFFVVPIYVRLLTTAEYGNYMAFQAWKDILIIIATLNLYCGVYTKAMVDYEYDRDRYTSTMQILSSIITILLYLLYIITPSYWDKWLEMDRLTIILLFGYFITFPAMSFWLVRQRVEYKYIRMVVVTIISSLVTPILSIVLLLCTNLQDRAVIYGFLISQITFGAYFYIYQLIKGRCLYNKFYWIHALKFNIPLIPHYMSLIILGQVDRIMIKDMAGASKAGIYSLAYQVSLTMNIFTMAINGALVPWFYTQLKNKSYTSIAGVSNKLCDLVGLGVIMMMLVAPELISLIGTKDYQEAVWIIPAVALSVHSCFCYGLFSNVQFYYGATIYVMIASVITAIVKIIINYIFIPYFGYISAGYSTLLCYLLLMLMHYIFMKIVLKKNNIKNKIFDIRHIVISTLILISLMIGCLYLYNYSWLKHIFIMVLLTIVITNQNKIRKIIQLNNDAK